MRTVHCLARVLPHVALLPACGRGGSPSSPTYGRQTTVWRVLQSASMHRVSALGLEPPDGPGVALNHDYHTKHFDP